MTSTAIQSRSGGLSISGPRCGELQCGLNEYCNFSDRCEDCTIICDSRTHNFDEVMCMNNCQNYIHDMRYMKLNTENANLTATVANLEKQVHSLTLTCAILLCFVIALGLAVIIPRSKGFCSWITRKFQKKKVHCATAFTHENPHTESPVRTHRARTQQTNVNIPTSQQNTAANITTSTIMSPSNNITNSTRIANTSAFTISNPGAYCDTDTEKESEQSNQTITSNCHTAGESQVPLQSSTPNETSNSERSFVRRNNNEIPLNVRNLNRMSSHYTMPDTPETQSTRVEELYLGAHTSRLPSEDCILELKENNIESNTKATVNTIDYRSPQRQVIYTTFPKA